MNVRVAIPILAAFVLLLGAFHPAAGPAPEWQELPQAAVRARQEQKLIWVHVYTNWCAWCKVMEKQAHRDPKTVTYLNTHFIPARLDAWERKPITFREREFKYLPERNAHELALSLLDGQMNFPTTVILTPDAEILTIVPGYLDITAMRKILVYYAESAWKTTTWDSFKKSYDY
ncbi:MAG: DUF255 domain-containing protein [Bacteroidetes bacterium]|nr:DUF255 domain-containing protein [Bacteroidota bacterium]